MPDTPLNEEALLDAMDALMSEVDADPRAAEWARKVATRVVSAYLSALPVQPDTVNSVMEDFINDRPGYITALKNTTGNDSTGDYWRWSGHAEARRQLATKLGWTVPHNPGETTRPVEG